MRQNDDVPFEVTPGIVEDVAEQVVAENAAAGECSVQNADMQPEDMQPEEVEREDMQREEVEHEEAPRANKNSAWKVLSSEDLPALSLREILGGDYLIGSLLRHNIILILMLVAMGIVYISNRYGAQQQILEEENLRKELQEKKNYAQTQYAQLTMQTRQSALERRLKELGDSTLVAPKEPPFIILKPGN